MERMADELLIYTVAINGLFGEGLKDVATPDFKQKLKALGIDVEKPLPAYPYPLWEAALELTAPLFPSLTPEQLHEELGRRTVRGSTANPILKAALAVGGLLGTTRALKHVIGRSGAHNSNVITFGDETGRSLVINSSFVGRRPGYSIGSFEALAELLGAKHPRATLLSSAPPAASYRIEWD